MALYYIDLENVHDKGFKGIEALGENDAITIFYSSKAPNIRIPTVQKLMKSKSKVEFIAADAKPELHGIQNSLDFFLVSILMLEYNSDNSFFIISEDKGFDCAVEAARYKGIDNVKRFSNIIASLTARSAFLMKQRKNQIFEKKEDMRIVDGARDLPLAIDVDDTNEGDNEINSDDAKPQVTTSTDTDNSGAIKETSAANEPDKKSDQLDLPIKEKEENPAEPQEDKSENNPQINNLVIPNRMADLARLESQIGAAVRTKLPSDVTMGEFICVVFLSALRSSNKTGVTIYNNLRSQFKKEILPAYKALRENLNIADMIKRIQANPGETKQYAQKLAEESA